MYMFVALAYSGASRGDVRADEHGLGRQWGLLAGGV